MHSAIDVTVRRSPKLALLLLLAHAATLALVWLLALPIGLHVGLKFAVLLSLLWSLTRSGWLVRKSYPFRLRLMPSDQAAQPDRVEVSLPSGKLVRGNVEEGSLVLAHLVILRCRPDGGKWWHPRRSWLLLTDSIPADDFRRLRVRLRWGRAAPV